MNTNRIIKETIEKKEISKNASDAYEEMRTKFNNYNFWDNCFYKTLLSVGDVETNNINLQFDKTNIDLTKEYNFFYRDGKYYGPSTIEEYIICALRYEYDANNEDQIEWIVKFLKDKKYQNEINYSLNKWFWHFISLKIISLKDLEDHNIKLKKLCDKSPALNVKKNNSAKNAELQLPNINEVRYFNNSKVKNNSKINTFNKRPVIRKTKKEKFNVNNVNNNLPVEEILGGSNKCNLK